MLDSTLRRSHRTDLAYARPSLSTVSQTDKVLSHHAGLLYESLTLQVLEHRLESSKVIG